VRLAVRLLSLDDAQARLRFEVRDTGVGIGAGELEQIFLPFEQAGEVPRRQGGTGLGLAISRQLVRLMGSDIGVESSPGGGSTFWFEAVFARSVLEARQAEMSNPVGYEGERRRVLVADDVQGNRSMLADLLGAVGFVVEEARDGREALERIREQTPHLVLMDMAMPVVDGLEATRRLRSDPLWRELPVVVVSANASGADKTRCLVAGANAFIAKPVDRMALLQLIGEQLGLQWRFEPPTEES
jgi:CheY-like chemotaxis protein